MSGTVPSYCFPLFLQTADRHLFDAFTCSSLWLSEVGNSENILSFYINQCLEFASIFLMNYERISFFQVEQN